MRLHVSAGSDHPVLSSRNAKQTQKFQERNGAARIGGALSDAVGRVLPLYQIRLNPTG
jgi:hypothetical protein